MKPTKLHGTRKLPESISSTRLEQSYCKILNPSELVKDVEVFKIRDKHIVGVDFYDTHGNKRRIDKEIKEGIVYIETKHKKTTKSEPEKRIDLFS